ncbi:hypothetical protein PKCBPO_03182 [Methylorubrum thiocyanatum]
MCPHDETASVFNNTLSLIHNEVLIFNDENSRIYQLLSGQG